jgi:hypothetical protein
MAVFPTLKTASFDRQDQRTRLIRLIQKPTRVV